MCGRYTFKARPEDVADHFGLDAPPPITPRFNIAPFQQVPVLAPHDERLRMTVLRWGFLPDDAESDAGIRPINARSDSMGKFFFARYFRAQRCLIAADGFYEWQAVGRKKNPVHFSLASGSVFAIAAMWSVWKSGSRKVATCCMITTEPNGVVMPYHDRMPVILAKDDYRRWLVNDTPQRELKAMLKPFPADAMTARRANPIVNKATSEGPECLAVPETPPPSSMLSLLK